MSKEKLQAAKQLVAEQLQLHHIEPSTSPWNSPIFIIKKKSGKWRLLHDLRSINAQMVIMGPVQRGLPMLTALPKGWPVITIDIKDCFFSIPIHEEDRPRFAFTVPAVNHEAPDERFQWRVLPQGMANSPTMCQLYVGRAIDPIQVSFPI